MYRDPIVEEIHQYREKYGRSLNYDIKAIADDLRNKQAASKRKFVKLPIKRQSNPVLKPTVD
jgi:hypothetical protein